MYTYNDALCWTPEINKTLYSSYDKNIFNKEMGKMKLANSFGYQVWIRAGWEWNVIRIWTSR